MAEALFQLPVICLMGVLNSATTVEADTGRVGSGIVAADAPRLVEFGHGGPCPDVSRSKALPYRHHAPADFMEDAAEDVGQPHQVGEAGTIPHVEEIVHAGDLSFVETAAERLCPHGVEESLPVHACSLLDDLDAHPSHARADHAETGGRGAGQVDAAPGAPMRTTVVYTDHDRVFAASDADLRTEAKGPMGCGQPRSPEHLAVGRVPVELFPTPVERCHTALPPCRQ